MKQTIILGSLITLITLSTALNAEENNDTIQTAKPTVAQLFSVKLTKVNKRKMSVGRQFFGFVKAEDSRIVDVTPRYGGFVEKLYADTQYAKVAKGDLLVKIYSPEVLQAKEDYLNSINFDAKRSSPSMLGSAKTKLELLGIPKAEILEVKKSRVSAKTTKIFSPVNGWIFEKSVNQGSAFKTGNKLFTIVDLDKVWIEAKIYQQDIPQLANLTQFRIKATGVDGEFSAKKLLLYPSLDPKEATATLRLEADNLSGRLRPGMYASITASAKSKEVVVIPRTAAIRKNGKWYAFLASEYEGEYEPIEIEIKPIDKNYYEVLSGLKEGDEVVDNSLFMMDSDAQINGLY